MKISERLSNLGTQTAPVEFRRRILASLDGERHLSTRSGRTWRSAFLLSGKPTRWLFPVAGLAALMIVLLYPITLPRTAFTASDSLFATALAGLTTVESLSSSNGDEVGDWLQLHVGYAVQVPRITGASIVGGRTAVFDGVTAAAVAYTMHGQPMTYVAVPAASVMSQSIAEDDVRTESANGYNVAIWRELGLLRAVVSPMSSRQVSSIANQCKGKTPT